MTKNMRSGLVWKMWIGLFAGLFFFSCGGNSTPKLTSISLSKGSLSPSFDPDVFTYNVSLSFLEAASTLTAQSQDGGDMVSVDGQTAKASQDSKSIVTTLAETETIHVTVENAKGDQTTYQIHFLRSANQKKLSKSSPTTEDYFGRAVSIHENDLAVGVSGNDSNGKIDNGAVYVYKKDSSGNWGSPQIIVPSDLQSMEYAGVSVSLYGDYLAVGVYNHSSGGKTNNGAVYVYKKDSSGIWGNEKKITAFDADDNDQFGGRVSMYENRIAISAVGENSNAGAVYLYLRDGSDNWGSEQKLTASDFSTNDFFGSWVEMNGDYLAIGSLFDDDNGADSGSVYVYKVNGMGVWGSEQKLTASDGAADDRFGTCVGLKGDRLVVGAPNNDDKGTDSGSVYVYTRQSGSGIWSSEQKIVSDDGQGFDQFGFAVVLGDDFLAVSATGDDDKASSGGIIFVYTMDTTNDFVNPTKLFPDSLGADDFFGGSMSIDGSSLVAGSQSDTATTDTGSVFTFSLE
ncbi:MAG: cadherin-like beta sandwich domain-containing protein [Bdellovibrionota bacterium]